MSLIFRKQLCWLTHTHTPPHPFSFMSAFFVGFLVLNSTAYRFRFVKVLEKIH